MKKMLFLFAFAFVSFNSFSQSLQKGSLVGLHTDIVKLNGKTTMDQFTDFAARKWAPAFASACGCEVRILKYVRGEGADKFSYMFIFKNEAGRDKFFKADGKMSDFGTSVFAKTKPVADELAKLGTMKGIYTDWLVQ
jgi:hypothetical protein